MKNNNIRFHDVLEDEIFGPVIGRPKPFRAMECVIEARRPFGRLFVFTDHHGDIQDAMAAAIENGAELVSKRGALHRLNGDEAEVSVFVPDCGGVSEHGLVIAGANSLSKEDIIAVARYVFDCACEGFEPDADDIRAAIFFQGLTR